MNPLIQFLLCGVAVLACSFSGCSAEAQPSRVDTAQLCAVKNAIRFGQRAWTPDECERIATALNDTANPRQMLAIAINESDLRERAINVIRIGVYDIGLMGVRCVTLGAVAEEIGTSSSVASQVGSAPRLLGQALISTGANSDLTPTPRDRCTNGAARGLYDHRLLDPVVNIRTAAAVLASHGGNLDGYNGCVQKRGRRCRYGENIAALVSALGGVEVKVRGARLRKLVKQVVEAINGRKQS